MNIDVYIKKSILNLNSQISEAENKFDNWIQTNDEWEDPEWNFEICFLQLISIFEVLNLNELKNHISKEYSLLKNKKSINHVVFDPEGGPHSKAVIILRKFYFILESFSLIDNTTQFSKDLMDILKYIHYNLTDITLYKSCPKDENDVHLRTEGILKCLFQDLKHKPVLTKPIKNFIPDTGIPSLKTLIEYKFLSEKSEIGRIADEVLADTRGYFSSEWNNFLYIIYETNRFRTEKEWNELLKKSGIPDNTKIIVLNGVPVNNLRVVKHVKKKKKK